MSDGILQSIDVEANLSGGQVTFPDEMSVTKLNVKRKFGGGGSKAKVNVIFEDALSDEQISGLRRSVRAATQQPRFDDVENFVDTEDAPEGGPENPKHTVTWDDLADAIENNKITPSNYTDYIDDPSAYKELTSDDVGPMGDGEDKSDVANAALEEGRITSGVVRQVKNLSGVAYHIKTWIDSLDGSEDDRLIKKRIAEYIVDFQGENEGSPNDVDRETIRENLREERASQIRNTLDEKKDGWNNKIAGTGQYTLGIDQILDGDYEQWVDDYEGEDNLSDVEEDKLILGKAVQNDTVSTSLGPAIATRIEGVPRDAAIESNDFDLSKEEAQEFLDNNDDFEDPIVKDANYEEKGDDVFSDWDEKATLTDKAKANGGVVTVEQLRTIEPLARAYLNKRDEEFKESERSGKTEAEIEQNRTEEAIRNDDTVVDEEGGKPPGWFENGEEEQDSDGLLDEDELFLHDPILLEIDIVVTEIEAGSVNQYKQRVFTGTVVKVLETNEKVIKFHALDARYQLNNFVVSMSVNGTDDPVPRGEVVRKIFQGNALFKNDGGGVLDEMTTASKGNVINQEESESDTGSGSGSGGRPKPTDPASDVTLEDILVGDINTDEKPTYGESYDITGEKPFPNVGGGPLEPTYVDFLLSDKIEKEAQGDQDHHLRKVSELTSISNAIEFSKISDAKAGDIADLTQTKQLAGRYEGVSQATVMNVRDNVKKIIHRIRGGDKYDEALQSYRDSQDSSGDSDSGSSSSGPDEIASYDIKTNVGSPINTTRSWGTDFYETAYQVIQDLVFESDAMIHIDEYNTVTFDKRTNITERKAITWGSESGDGVKKLPPILGYEGGDEKSKNNVIVESKLGSNALGAFGPTMTVDAKSKFEGNGVESGVKMNAVSSVTEVKKSQVSKILDRDMMLDSGTLKLAGDPRINEWDRIILDEKAVDGFSTVSQSDEGEPYVIDEVRHKVDPKEGYITEVDLSSDPEKLLKKFAGVETDEPAEQAQDERQDSSPSGPVDTEGALSEAIDSVFAAGDAIITGSDDADQKAQEEAEDFWEELGEGDLI